MDRLPKVFANRLSHNINNDQKIFYGGNREIVNNSNEASIKKKISDIFSSSNHVYKSKVLLRTNSGDTEKIIVGKTSSNLITIQGELIKISDIIDIKKIY